MESNIDLEESSDPDVEHDCNKHDDVNNDKEEDPDSDDFIN